MSAAELWCMRTLGPDELFAAKSREAAEKMVEDLNAAIRRQNETHPWMVEEFPPPWAAVELWPGRAETHAKDLEQAT